MASSVKGAEDEAVQNFLAFMEIANESQKVLDESVAATPAEPTNVGPGRDNKELPATKLVGPSSSLGSRTCEVDPREVDYYIKEEYKAKCKKVDSDEWEPNLNPYVSREEYLRLQEESATSRAKGIAWKKRGPPGPDEGGPKRWRGQRYRPKTKKWMNRGGSNRAWYCAYFAFINKKKAEGKEITPALKWEASEFADSRAGPKKPPAETETPEENTEPEENAELEPK